MSEHIGRSIAERGSLEVIDCHRCGWAHLTRVPATASDPDYYASEFWQQKKAGARLRLFEQGEWWAAIHGDWLEMVERMTMGRRLLDVGAGYGQFAHLAAGRGWRVETVEPSDDCIDSLRAFGLGHPLAADWQQVQSGSWDCISALWLVEHLADPAAWLRWARERIYSGGTLLLVVPNDFSAAQLEMNEYAGTRNWWMDETHYSYFNWATLGNLLGRTGWKLVHRLTLTQMEQFIPIVDYTVDGAAGARLHDVVAESDLRMPRAERLGFYGGLARQGLGRELVAICEPC